MGKQSPRPGLTWRGFIWEMTSGCKSENDRLTSHPCLLGTEGVPQDVRLSVLKSRKSRVNWHELVTIETGELAPEKEEKPVQGWADELAWSHSTFWSASQNWEEFIHWLSYPISQVLPLGVLISLTFRAHMQDCLWVPEAFPTVASEKPWAESERNTMQLRPSAVGLCLHKSGCCSNG